MYEIFAKLLKEKGVTPYQVHKATGVAQSSLSDWKNGKSKPKYEKMAAIADYFGVSVDYLLGREEKKAPVQMDEGDELDRQIMDLFKQLTPEDKQKIIDFTAWSIERQDDGQK